MLRRSEKLDKQQQNKETAISPTLQLNERKASTKTVKKPLKKDLNVSEPYVITSPTALFNNDTCTTENNADAESLKETCKSAKHEKSVKAVNPPILKESKRRVSSQTAKNVLNKTSDVDGRRHVRFSVETSHIDDAKSRKKTATAPKSKKNEKAENSSKLKSNGRRVLTQTAEKSLNEVSHGDENNFTTDLNPLLSSRKTGNNTNDVSDSQVLKEKNKIVKNKKTEKNENPPTLKSKRGKVSNKTVQKPLIEDSDGDEDSFTTCSDPLLSSRKTGNNTNDVSDSQVLKEKNKIVKNKKTEKDENPPTLKSKRGKVSNKTVQKPLIEDSDGDEDSFTTCSDPLLSSRKTGNNTNDVSDSQVLKEKNKIVKNKKTEKDENPPTLKLKGGNVSNKTVQKPLIEEKNKIFKNKKAEKDENSNNLPKQSPVTNVVKCCKESVKKVEKKKALSEKDEFADITIRSKSFVSFEEKPSKLNRISDFGKGIFKPIDAVDELCISPIKHVKKPIFGVDTYSIVN